MTLLGARAQAGSVTVPLDGGAKRPAADLSYQGRAIDETQAWELRKSGVDLSTLNPVESLLWKDTRQPFADDQGYPVGDGRVVTVAYDSLLASTKGIFRASIDAQDSRSGQVRPFTLSVSLGIPAAIMRAGLLRAIGYRDAAPQFYPRLRITFKDVAERDHFLDDLADRSLTSRKRWIADDGKGAPEGKPEVTLQGVVLEPGRIQVQAVHWGLMTAALQQDRRVFRALLLAEVLVDFQEKINGFAWNTGRIFSQSYLFDYLYSDGFADVTSDDIKWIMRRMAALSRADLEAIARLPRLPDDITALLTEKLVARRNGLVDLLGLDREFVKYPYDAHLSVGHVVNGQLTRDDYTGYPQEFFTKPALPPLRFSQIWRYLAIEGISAGLGQALSQINSHLLTLQSSSDAIGKHQEEVNGGMGKYLFKTGKLSGYQQTTGVWAKPIAGANINASRTVVAGTYLGSDSQVQLVDTLSVDVSAGAYFGWDGIAGLTPGLTNSVTLSRSYSHVKPVQDMNAALKANWGRLVVAGFMVKLAESLNPNIKCTIPETAWTSEFELGGAKYTRINYDQKRPNGKAEALALRDKLIKEGQPADKIILQANDRDEDCKTEVEKAVNKNLEGFMDGLAVGDTFIVTDTVKFGASASVSIPVGVLAAAVAPSASADYQIARQTMIRRVANGFQIYLQDRRLDTEQVGLDANFYINIAGYTRGVRHGRADTDFYTITTEGADTATKQKLIRALKGLLRTNSSEILTDGFDPYTLHHDLNAKISHLKFLLWSRDFQAQAHEVDVFPPRDPDGKYNRGDYKRTLAMRRMVTRNGQDLFGYALDSAGRLTGGLVSLPGIGGGDPGNSPGGKSWTGAISTQAEVTPGRAFRPVTVLEQTYRGWSMPRKDLMKVLDRIEGAYGSLASAPGRGLFNRAQFDQTASLQLYQIDTTLLFYPEAVDRIFGAAGWLGAVPEKQAFQTLVSLYGADRNRTYCEAAEMNFGRHGAQIYHGQGFRGCAPDWIHALLKLRRQGRPQGPTSARAQLDWINSAMSYLVNNVPVAAVLSRLDAKEFFFVTRVNGFRKNDSTGAIDYLADTVGRYDSELGLGMYRDFASNTGISVFELFARFFTDGL